MSFAHQWTHGNLPVRKCRRDKWDWGTLHQKRQI